MAEHRHKQVEKSKSTPQRKCVGCSSIKNKGELIRVVKSPENEISIDGRGKKSGRGAYLCRDPECLKKAVKAKRLDRSFKTKVSDEILKSLLVMMESET